MTHPTSPSPLAGEGRVAGEFKNSSVLALMSSLTLRKTTNLSSIVPIAMAGSSRDQWIRFPWPPLCHLAPGRISSAEKENFFYLCHDLVFCVEDFGGYEASMILFIPPRTLNSPVTTARIGLEALTKSLRIRLTAFS